MNFFYDYNGYVRNEYIFKSEWNYIVNMFFFFDAVIVIGIGKILFLGSIFDMICDVGKMGYKCFLVVSFWLEF